MRFSRRATSSRRRVTSSHEGGDLVAPDHHRVLGDDVVGGVVEHPLGQFAPVRGAEANQADDAHRRGVADEARQLFLRLRPQVLQDERQRLRELRVALQANVPRGGLRVEQRERQRRQRKADRDGGSAVVVRGQRAALRHRPLQREGRGLEAHDTPGERRQLFARPRFAPEHAVQHGHRRLVEQSVDHARSVEGKKKGRRGAPRCAHSP